MTIRGVDENVMKTFFVHPSGKSYFLNYSEHSLPITLYPHKFGIIDENEILKHGRSNLINLVVMSGWSRVKWIAGPAATLWVIGVKEVSNYFISHINQWGQTLYSGMEAEDIDNSDIKVYRETNLDILVLVSFGFRPNDLVVELPLRCLLDGRLENEIKNQRFKN